MRLTLFIGPTEACTSRLRGLFKQTQDALAKQHVEAPDWNHVRLYTACVAPENVCLLRFKRGLDSPLTGKMLAREFDALIAEQVKQSKAKHFVVAAAQLGSLLHQPEEIERLRALLAPHFARIDIVAHVDEQARQLRSHYAYAVAEGRTTGLEPELALAQSANWWDGAVAGHTDSAPELGIFNDIQAPPFWLDYARLISLWGDVFGKQRVQLRALDLPVLMSQDGAQELVETLGLKKKLGTVKPDPLPQPEPACNLTRMRQFNAVLIPYAQVHDVMVPRDLLAQMLGSLRIPGAPIDAGALSAVSDHFKKDNAKLVKRFPGLKAALTPDPPQEPWKEADPQLGFRATQYLAAYGYAIRKHGTPLAQRRAEQETAKASEAKFDAILTGDDAAEGKLLDRIKVNHRMMLSSRFRPHNNLGTVHEEELTAAYTLAPPRVLPKGNTGNVIVSCMKNEAPYIVEWVAYHRAIGIDNFVVYTNGCDDSTGPILDRLQQMGVLEHRSNEDWKGNSPQQHALNNAIQEPVVQNAEWIIHIDVDEFMNIRTGNGTVEDLLAALPPETSNIAMTWRLFGHNGVTKLSNDFVIDQFDACAPKFCPKPHTVWGYKTMTRNIGAYAKLSCHRPNKLAPEHEDRVKWVNGSGADMTTDAAHNGWRSSKSNVGYDLLQLNHYALRSAESFLIKRQRGRALHVDRSIGINYWIRMDWNDFRDITIKRNLPRLRVEYDRLMQDDILRAHHEDGLAWHQAKAAELHEMPEFSDLYDQALAVKLNETERVAYALSLDMES